MFEGCTASHIVLCMPSLSLENEGHNNRPKIQELINSKGLPVFDCLRKKNNWNKKNDNGILQSDQFRAIVVDGADKGAFWLFHFGTKTKDERESAFQIWFIGILDYQKSNIIHLFVMTDEHGSSAMHIVKCLHRFMKYCLTPYLLPQSLCMQANSCTREK